MCQDGLSNTFIIGEKRLVSTRYTVGDWHDDRGWTDGWDPDVGRLTVVQIERDSPTVLTGYEFGSAHTTGMNGLFGDGTVRFIPFNIKPAILDALGDRRDGVNVTIDF